MVKRYFLEWNHLFSSLMVKPTSIFSDGFKLLPIYLKHFETSDLFLGNCFRPLAAKFRHSWVSDIGLNCLACLIHFNPSRSIYGFGTWRKGLFGDLYNQFSKHQNSYEVGYVYTHISTKFYIPAWQKNEYPHESYWVGWLPHSTLYIFPSFIPPLVKSTVSRWGIAGETVEVGKVEKEFTTGYYMDNDG